MFNINKLMLVLLFLSLTQFVFATPTPADYGALPTVDMVAISPNGVLMAYRKTTPTQDAIVVMSITEKKLVAAFDISKMEPRRIEFFNNNQLYLMVTEHIHLDGSIRKVDAGTAYVYDIQEKNLKPLLPPVDMIFPTQSGLGRIMGISDDAHIALLPAWSNVDPYNPVSHYNLYKSDLTKKSVKLAAEGTSSTDDYFIDDKGNVIAREDFDDKAHLHQIFSRQNNKWVEIFSESAEVRKKNFVGVTQDFKSLLFVERNEEVDHDVYKFMNLLDGKISEANFEREGTDIESAVIDLQRVVRGLIYGGFSPSYKFFDSNVDEQLKTILSYFPEQSVFIESFSPDWKHILIRVEGSDFASAYFLVEKDQKPSFLMSGRMQIKSADLNLIGKVTFTTSDGLKIPTLITVPKDKVSDIKNLPAVVMPHGGPAAHDHIEFDYFAQALASQGYLVIQPQFRGSTGFGLKHHDAGFGEWGRKMQEDITEAVNFFAKKGMIDREKVCIVGASYGGYAALAGGAFTPDLYKCVVSINGISDLDSFITYEKNHNGNNSEAYAYWKRQLDQKENYQADLEQLSPYNFAKSFKAPVLLIKSTEDRTVQPEQSNTMLRALKGAKKPVNIVTLENENHYLLKQETRTQAVEETVKFVNQYLK